MSREPDARLQLTADEMRQLGYAVVDLIVEHLGALPQRPATRRASRSELERLLREPIPARGSAPLAVLERIRRDVLGHIMHLDHPRFFGFIPSPSNFVSVMADTLATGFNVFAGTWLESSAAAELELVTVDWLRELCGMPERAGGLFTSGGSLANLTALAVARRIGLGDRIDDAVIYGTDQTHSSIPRALRLLGFPTGAWRPLPSDAAYRVDVDALREAIERDRAAGRRPFCVVATPGTTNTGATDPLPALADLCETQGLWLHADAAYGGAALLCARGRTLLTGIDRVDSLTLDPHKWLFQPYEIGCVLIRDRGWLRETFAAAPEYLRDAASTHEEPNFYEYGPQLTRSFRALKLWMSLQVFGVEAFALAVEHGLELAEEAERAVRALPGWTVVTPAQLGIVTFRRMPAGMSAEEADSLNESLVSRLNADGFAMVSSTRLRGRVTLHMCCVNPRATALDVRETIEKLDAIAARD